LQHITLRAFNASIHFSALKPFCFGGNGVQTPLDGFFKSSVLARGDANIGKFLNHDGGLSKRIIIARLEKYLSHQNVTNK
jgi:hypothetical protein